MENLKTPIKLDTPRGMITIRNIFETMEEARENGFGLWFQFQNYLILAKDNMVDSAVKVK